jgi:MoxR-like ATPase
MAPAPVGGDGIEKLEDMVVRAAETSADHVRAAKAAIGNVIFGQDAVIDQALITILCGGHGLLVGVPGLAKTKLVETMGIALGLDAKRIQFTPDLMPSDILGTEVLEESQAGKRSFRFIQGPVFAQSADAVGALASHARATRHRRRRTTRSAAAVSCPRHTKSH